MIKILSLIGSIMLFIGGLVSAESQVSNQGKVNAEKKDIKDISSSAAMNCGSKDCSMIWTDINK